MRIIKTACPVCGMMLYCFVPLTNNGLKANIPGHVIWDEDASETAGFITVDRVTYSCPGGGMLQVPVDEINCREV